MGICLFRQNCGANCYIPFQTPVGAALAGTLTPSHEAARRERAVARWTLKLGASSLPFKTSC
ncbi:hypothetical protein BRCON_2047 [Candidatus Sumerlaea chitinivorans]|uniref:Uncharacterized protein n=1 Tax=Sumerlaea chitinivorans TaxID=2250252 RepID=A0A2Z4Y6J8_SUMC1|nr:hypothetical protein BRCON_2047 [Candidatus Sumerlaea chitinivorans]